jgi:hypothetical protein
MEHEFYIQAPAVPPLLGTRNKRKNERIFFNKLNYLGDVRGDNKIFMIEKWDKLWRCLTCFISFN